MAKVKTIYVCSDCGQAYARWQGRCDQCQSWNTLVEQIESSENQKNKKALINQDKLIWSMAKAVSEKKDFLRISTQIEELDRCFGADAQGQMGMVQGSVVLIGGEPGIGKSTLLTQVVINACRQLETETWGQKSKKSTKDVENHDKPVKDGKYVKKNLDKSLQNQRVMYVCGEESPQQINIRIQRLLKKSEQMEKLALDYVMTTNVDAIVELVRQRRPALLIVDSIQMLRTDDLVGQAGSLGQVKECTERITKTVKTLNIPTFLVGHVVKGGEIAGPKILEHMVDAIFELSGERSGDLRFLRTLKNRFGATDEVGVFQMKEDGMREVKNPSEYFLQSAQLKVPGSGVVCLLEGTRPLLTEVQALVVTSQLAMPRRVGRGVDLSRVQVLSAVLQKHCGLPLGVMDIFLSVVGGMTVREAGIDLGLAVALASSLAEKTLPEKAVFIGEVGLMGEIRPVAAYERRVKEVKRLGYEQIYSYASHQRVKDLLQDLRIK